MRERELLAQDILSCSMLHTHSHTSHTHSVQIIAIRYYYSKDYPYTKSIKKIQHLFILGILNLLIIATNPHIHWHGIFRLFYQYKSLQKKKTPDIRRVVSGSTPAEMQPPPTHTSPPHAHTHTLEDQRSSEGLGFRHTRTELGV